MKKMISLVISLLILMTAVGCGSQESAQEEKNGSINKGPVSLEITDCGYTIENGYVMYALELNNPNENYEAEFANIKIVGKDSEGGLIFADDWTIGQIDPTTITYWASQAGDGTVPEDAIIDFSISVEDRNWVKKDPHDAYYSFNNLSLSPRGSYGYKLLGEITLNVEVQGEYTGIDRPIIICILRDENGKIISGFDGFLDSSLSTNEPYVFEVDTYRDIPEYATYEVYANPWG